MTNRTLNVLTNDGLVQLMIMRFFRVDHLCCAPVSVVHKLQLVKMKQHHILSIGPRLTKLTSVIS